MTLFGVYPWFAKWTQVVILQLTSRSSESSQKLLVCFVTLCITVTAVNALSCSYRACVPKDGGEVVTHKPHMRSPHLEQKDSVTAETSVMLITEQRGVCFCLVPPFVPKPQPVPTSVKKRSGCLSHKGTSWWRVIPPSGPVLFHSQCWGDWECPFQGERLQVITLSIFNTGCVRQQRQLNTIFSQAL